MVLERLNGTTGTDCHPVGAVSWGLAPPPHLAVKCTVRSVEPERVTRPGSLSEPVGAHGFERSFRLART
jgi:hypothetical protein